MLLRGGANLNTSTPHMPEPPKSIRTPVSAARPVGRRLLGDIPEVWVRFLFAIFGLALAFGAALFSTIFRESGHLWATVVLASAALLLSALVGLATVPYLARRVAAGRVGQAFEYDVTRVGVIYVVLILIIAIAALNTGNNLLYIIVAAMLAAIVVSGIASALVLRNLELDVRLPQHVFAGRPTQGRIVLRNPRRWLPAFSIQVVAAGPGKAAQHWRWVPSTFAFPPWKDPDKHWIRLPDRQLRRVRETAAPAEIFQGPAYFPHIPPRGELAADLELCFDRRGRYQQGSFGLATRFPFAFLLKTRRLALSREIIVYPAVEPTDELFEVLPLITGELESFLRGRGTDLYRIREYMPEDSARHVDWKATAKSGSLKVREFSREDERKLRVVFDNPAPDAVSDPIYEKAVTLTASLVWHFATAANVELTFVAPNYGGGGDMHQFLAYLALVQPKTGPSILENLEVSSDYNIVVTARTRGTLPTSLWTCSHFVFIGGRGHSRA
jgi:uncharacterized protein (DUF58 family)